VHRHSIIQTEQNAAIPIPNKGWNDCPQNSHFFIKLINIWYHHISFFLKSVGRKHLPDSFLAPFETPDSQQHEHGQNKGYLAQSNHSSEPRRVDIPGEKNKGNATHRASFSRDH
jgi:hypothetical protein